MFQATNSYFKKKKNKTFRGKYGKYLCELMDTERKEFLLKKKQKTHTIKGTFDI